MLKRFKRKPKGEGITPDEIKLLKLAHEKARKAALKRAEADGELEALHDMVLNRIAKND